MQAHSTWRERWREEWKISGPLILYPGIALALIFVHPFLAVLWIVFVGEEVKKSF